MTDTPRKGAGMTRHERIKAILQPILNEQAAGNAIVATALIHQTAINTGKSASTIYRWLRCYKEGRVA